MHALACACSVLLACTVCLMSARAETSARAIYRCEAGGVLTFSDRPCDSNATVHELDAGTLNTFEPTPVQPSARRAVPARKSTKKAAGAAMAADKHKQTCERLAQGLKDIRAKQRSGYKASEGERLKARETKLKSQLRTARCG